MLSGLTFAFLGLRFAATHANVIPASTLWWLSYLLAVVWLLAAWVLWNRERRGGIQMPQERALHASGRIQGYLNEKDIQFLVAVLVLSAVFRFSALERMPWGYAGLHIDAAYNAHATFRILDGEQLFAPVVPSIAYMRDAGLHYYLAPFFGLFGRSIQAFRLALNLLSLLNIALLFFILRRYSRNWAVLYGCTALYAFYGTDVIFCLSGVEYVMVTPFLLGSFILLLRTMDSGSRRDALGAGMLWGLGFSTHYSYLGLALAIPLVIAFSRTPWRLWRSAFLTGGYWGLMPKASYLLFGYQGYFQRLSDVMRHDDSGRFLVPSALLGNVDRLWTLLFRDGIYDRWYLPEDKLLPLLIWPILVVGMIVAIRQIRKPHHSWALVVTLITLGANLFSFPMDYRWMNWMPVMFLLVAIGATGLEGLTTRIPWIATFWWLLLGTLFIQSLEHYFYFNPGPQIMENYACREVAIARAVVEIQPSERAYILAPHLTYRTHFFNIKRPDILDLSYLLDSRAQVTYSSASEAEVIRNLERILGRERSGKDTETINIFLSPDSPYSETVSRYLRDRVQARSEALKVLEPVSGEIIALTWLRFFVS